MPTAFENFGACAQNQQCQQSASLATPFTGFRGEQGSLLTFNYDHGAIGAHNSSLLESPQGTYEAMSTEQVYRTLDDGIVLVEEISTVHGAIGAYNSCLMESPQGTCETMSTEQVYGMVGNGIVPNQEINPDESPKIEIIVQPVSPYRFRYETEMTGNHGSLLGEKKDSSRMKVFPTVKFINCHLKTAVIRCTLVTVDEGRYPHAHQLVRNYDKKNNKYTYSQDIIVSDEQRYTAIFSDMGIIHTGKKKIKEEFKKKRRFEILEEKRRTTIENATITTTEESELAKEAKIVGKSMNIHCVALCFQGFYYGENNELYPLTDKEYSQPINNLKSVLVGKLKICHINKDNGSCKGDEEVWLLVEKVCKGDIKVIFNEVDERGTVIWEREISHSELVVHHQVVIIFKTLPYKDINIRKEKQVNLKLMRPSDGKNSNSIKFTYTPSDKVSIDRKRPRMPSVSDSKKTHQNIPSTPILENCMSMASEICMNLEEQNTNSSGEWKKISNESNVYKSAELRDSLDDFILEELTSLCNNTADSPTLVPDGGDFTDFKKPQKDFSRDTVKGVVHILKGVVKSNVTKKAALIKIKELLEETTNYGNTPLHFALRHKQSDTVKHLLKILSSDMSLRKIANLQNSNGQTPLHLAVFQNQPEIVRALLKLCVDPNLCDGADASPLHIAVRMNARECLGELLHSDAKLNLEARDEIGWSALHHAAKAGSLHDVEALVEAGANVNSIETSYGKTALHIAVDCNHKHIVNYLLTKAKIDVSIKSFEGNTALHSAVNVGGKYEDLIVMLKKHKDDLKIRHSNVHEENGVDKECILSREEKLAALIEKELELKDTEDETTVQNRLQPVTPSCVSISSGRKSSSSQGYTKSKSTTKANFSLQQLELMKQSYERLSEDHVKRIVEILDRTGDWVKLANHMNLGSLVRLYQKLYSPSYPLLMKLRIQNPDITVREMRNILVEVGAFEAETALN